MKAQLGVRLHRGKPRPSPRQTCGSVVFNRRFLENVYERRPDGLAMRERFDTGQVFLTRYWREVLEILTA